MSKLTPRSIIFLDAQKFGKVITVDDGNPIEECSVELQFDSAIIDDPSQFTVSCVKLIVGLQRLYHNVQIDYAMELRTLAQATALDTWRAYRQYLIELKPIWDEQMDVYNQYLTDLQIYAEYQAMVDAHDVWNLAYMQWQLTDQAFPQPVEPYVPEIPVPIPPLVADPGAFPDLPDRPVATQKLTFMPCQSLQEMIQLLQNFANRAVQAIMAAEYGEVILQGNNAGMGTNIQAEIDRRVAYNIVSTQYNAQEPNALLHKPILETNINITVDPHGNYVYTGFDPPSLIIAFDPSYHFFLRFNRFYAFGDGPIGNQFTGDPPIANPAYYPGNEVNGQTDGWCFDFATAFRGHFNIVQPRLTHAEVLNTAAAYYRTDMGCQDNYSQIKEINLSTSLMVSSSISNARRKYRTFDSFSVTLTGGMTTIGASFSGNNELTSSLQEVSLGELVFNSPDMILGRQMVIRQQSPVTHLKVSANVTCYNFETGETFEQLIPLAPGARFLAKFAFVALDQQTTNERQLNYGLA